MDALITLATIGGVFATLIATRIGPDLVLMTAMAALLVTGVLSPQRALEGFSNPGMLTVAMLYVLAASLRQTGVVRWVADHALGRPASLRGAYGRMVAPTAIMSAFMNNTAVVAMFIPAVRDWGRRLGLSPSRLLIPLSYIAILGGTCTLIGTSTNLVVDGLMQSQGHNGLGLFDIAAIGLPALAVGTGVLLLLGARVLPEREGLVQQVDNAREYVVDMRVPEGSPLAGKRIGEAGLRHLAHGYLMEVEREGELLTAVGSDFALHGNDTLRFIGEPRCANEVRAIRGLEPASHRPEKLNLADHQRCLIEVVLSPDFPGNGQTVREFQFRTHYKAAILAISRRGERLTGKLGDITLQSGDTLLLEGSPDFVDQYRYRRDFLLVNLLNDSASPSHQKAPMAIGILALMVLANLIGLVSVFEAALLAAGVCVATRCITPAQARRAIDYPVLIVIAAAFALGNAMADSGAARMIGDLLLSGGIEHPWLALVAIYALTVALTESITNNAAAVLIFPIAMALAESLNVSMLPFAITIMMAASASFMTPIGYQTNLMVMGPGSYRFTDYLRLGLPTSIAVGVVSITLIPQLFPF